MTNLYKCQSYYDEQNILRECTCKMCGTKADWLRSEIEKLGSEIKPGGLTDIRDAKNEVFISIITRYKEELKVLESK